MVHYDLLVIAALEKFSDSLVFCHHAYAAIKR
jgi:hypothetical protein